MVDQKSTRQNFDAKHVQKAIDDAVTLDSAAVAALPAASAANAGKLMYCTNGASGQPCLAYSNGTAWLRVLLGAAVSAT